MTDKERFEEFKKKWDSYIAHKLWMTARLSEDEILRRMPFERLLDKIRATKSFDDLYETLEDKNALWDTEITLIAELIESLAALED